MWIMTNRGYYSAVQHNDDPNLLMVRSRVAGHLEALFENMEDENNNSINDLIEYTPDADYLYRVTVSRENFHIAIEDEIENIHYSNFKNSVEDDDLHATYEHVWLMTYMLQAAKDKISYFSGYMGYAYTLTNVVRDEIQKFVVGWKK